MKTKILSAALLLSSMFAFSAMAEEPTTTVNTCGNEATECAVAPGQCDRQARMPKRQHKARPELRQQPRQDLFAGINLTPEQKSALDALKPTRECNGENANCEGQQPLRMNENCAHRGQRQQCSQATQQNSECTQANAQNHECAQARGQRRDCDGPRGAKRAEYVKKVKEILTPDQYVIFLENIVFGPQTEAQAIPASPAAE